MIHSHHPLQSAARRHRKHRTRDGATSTDSRRREKVRRKTEAGVTPGMELADSSTSGLEAVFTPGKETSDAGFDFNRSLSEPAGETPRGLRETSFSPKQSVDKLLPISEENVKVSGLLRLFNYR